MAVDVGDSQTTLVDVAPIKAPPRPEWDGVQPWDYKIPWPTYTTIFEPCGYARNIPVYLIERGDYELATGCPWSSTDHTHTSDIVSL